jgi:DUF4097 and DUF4098 domain-containing protein YvlB
VNSETFERSFSVTGLARLALSNIRGSVEIVPGSDDTVQVTAVKDLESGDAEQTHLEIVQNDDGVVTVATRFQEGQRLFSRARPCAVAYTVRLPRECEVKVECVSSTLAARGLTGEFELQTVSGEMSLQDLAGALRVTSVSGDIHGERLSGQLRLRAVSGNVQLANCDLPMIEGTTVSGDLAFETPLGQGPYRFNSVSGNVVLSLPATTSLGASLELNTVSGHVKAPGLSGGKQRTMGRTKLSWQGGGTEIRLSSISGDLVLSHDGEGQSTERPRLEDHGREVNGRVSEQPRLEVGEAEARSEVHEEAPAAPRSPSEILQELAAGRLTAAEAERLLRGRKAE